MGEAFDIYNLFFLALAVVIFLRLRSVLGRRTGNERKPYDPYSAPDNAEGMAGAGDDGKVVNLPGRRGDERAGGDKAEKPDWEKHAPTGSALAKGFDQIFAADRSFDPTAFLDGAKLAYEMIVTAFAQGDKRTLKSLLSAEVFEGFSSAIDEREENGQTTQSSFVGISKADLVEASLKDRKANVTVSFISELISATFDADGKVIDGDPKKVREVTDIWTFMHDVRSRDPNWKLVATEAAQ